MKTKYFFLFIIFLVLPANLIFAQPSPPVCLLPVENSNFLPAQQVLLKWTGDAMMQWHYTMHISDNQNFSNVVFYYNGYNNECYWQLSNNYEMKRYYWRVQRFAMQWGTSPWSSTSVFNVLDRWEINNNYSLFDSTAFVTTPNQNYSNSINATIYPISDFDIFRIRYPFSDADSIIAEITNLPDNYDLTLVRDTSDLLSTYNARSWNSGTSSELINICWQPNTGYTGNYFFICINSNGNFNHSSPYTLSLGITHGNNPVTGFSNISPEIPKEMKLYNNYPNPFNSATNIIFNISRASNVSLKIYNLLGKEIETLVNENLIAGKYNVRWNASQYASGLYFYQINADGFLDTKKMLMIK